MIHNGSYLHQMEVNIAEKCVLPLATIFTSLWARIRECWKVAGVGEDSKHFPHLPTFSLPRAARKGRKMMVSKANLRLRCRSSTRQKSAAECLAFGAPRKAGGYWLQRMNLASLMHRRGAGLTNMLAAGSVFRRVAECMIVHGTSHLRDSDE